MLFLLFQYSLLIAGCSAKGWYEGGKSSAIQKCNQLPLGDREYCLEGVNTTSYEEYKTSVLKDQ